MQKFDCIVYSLCIESCFISTHHHDNCSYLRQQNQHPKVFEHLNSSRNFAWPWPYLHWHHYWVNAGALLYFCGLFRRTWLPSRWNLHFTALPPCAYTSCWKCNCVKHYHCVSLPRKSSYTDVYVDHLERLWWNFLFFHSPKQIPLS